MSDYFNVTTNVGDAAIATAIANNSKLNITHIAFGDGNGSVPTPTKTRTSLVREVHRQAVTKYAMHPTIANYIVIETIIPSNIGGFWIREMGIIADNVLISHGSHAPFFKVADPDGVSEYRLKFTQNVRDGNVVEISLNESLIYASQAWVNENYIHRNEVVDNLTTNDAKKPVSAKQAKVLQDTKLGKTENAATATKLQTARTIGGVSFDGSANINLPGVNASGNQNTSGNAATATKLQTARTIAISGAVTGTATGFDGSADIAIATTAIDGSKISTGTIPAARIPTLNQSTTGNAATATKLQTARTIAISGAVTGTATGFDGSENIAIATTAIDGSKINTGTIPAARIPAASTIAAGAVKLNNTLTSTSTTEALTAAQGKALNDKKLDNNAFGNGVNVTSSRISGATYTNPYDRPLIVVMSLWDTDGANFKLKIGDLVYTSPYDFPQTGMFAFTFVVPPNAEYMVKWAPGSWPLGLNFWWEF